MAKMGRKPKEINWEIVANLCSIQCTQEEIEFITGISVRTLRDRAPKEKGVTFPEYIKEHATRGLMSLRRWQFRAAEKQAEGKGNVSMLIWLGKNYLGQSEDGSRIKSQTNDSDKDDVEQLADWLKGLENV